jgi:hypothetical protein
MKKTMDITEQNLTVQDVQLQLQKFQNPYCKSALTKNLLPLLYLVFDCKKTLYPSNNSTKAPKSDFIAGR